MKIHFPLTGFNLSGGVRVIIKLANGLVDRGYQVRITVPAYRSTPPFPLDSRIDLTVLGEDSTTRAGYSRILAREAANWGDVLIATNFKTPHLIRQSIEKNRSSARILYLIQGYEPYTQGTLFEGSVIRRWLHRRLALSSYAKADARAYVSKAIAEKVGIDSSPSLVHPGLDPSIFYPGDEKNEESKIRIGMIARPGRLKGSHLFLDAVSQVQDIHPKVQWVILRVGDLPFTPPLGAEVVAAENDSDMGDFYRSLDVFVMPSLYEGFGLPALEAMACGASLITSDVDGVREFAEDGVNALVIPADNSMGLAEAMVQLVQGETLRCKLAENGIRTAKRFSWNNTVHQFEKVLHEVEKKK